jgi:hypothetical protein
MTRTMVAKFGSTCTCCGGAIERGELIEWTKGKGARHAWVRGDLPAKCFGVLKQQGPERGPDIGQMVDMAYEDSCRDACGL